MPADWYLPSQATATLTVGVARGEIVDFRVTPAAEQGEIIGPATEPVAIGVRNVGSLAGAISLAIIDKYDNSIVWTGSITLAIDEFNWVYPAINYPMPARDLELRAQAYHGLIIDSYIDVTVVLIVSVVTNITLTLEPASLEPGATYHYKGSLTRTDTGDGLAGMVIIARREGVEVGSGITGADGSYDIAATAPSATGNFNCMAVFPGVVPFAASSAQVSLGVGVISPQFMYALAAAIVGVSVVAVSRMS